MVIMSTFVMVDLYLGWTHYRRDVVHVLRRASHSLQIGGYDVTWYFESEDPEHCTIYKLPLDIYNVEGDVEIIDQWVVNTGLSSPKSLFSFTCPVSTKQDIS